MMERRRILVVDDEKEIRDVLYQAFTEFGDMEVELAENGEEALQKIEKTHFDLVLTDLQMPKMGGLQLVDEISKNRPESSTNKGRAILTLPLSLFGQN